jgi:hypothetical protein
MPRSEFSTGPDKIGTEKARDNIKKPFYNYY